MHKTILTAALLLAASFTASATGTQTTFSGNAASQCRGALPVYEGGLRSRPLAIVNEGNTTTFVNCAFIVPVDSYGVDSFSATVFNRTGSPVTISCTGVAGIEGGPRNSYYVKSITVSANAQRTVGWTANADNGGNRWDNSRGGQTANQNVGFQCVLPPQTSIGALSVTYRYGG